MDGPPWRPTQHPNHFPAWSWIVSTTPPPPCPRFASLTTSCHLHDAPFERRECPAAAENPSTTLVPLLGEGLQCLLRKFVNQLFTCFTVRFGARASSAFCSDEGYGLRICVVNQRTKVRVDSAPSLLRFMLEKRKTRPPSGSDASHRERFAPAPSPLCKTLTAFESTE